LTARSNIFAPSLTSESFSQTRNNRVQKTFPYAKKPHAKVKRILRGGDNLKLSKCANVRRTRHKDSDSLEGSKRLHRGIQQSMYPAGHAACHTDAPQAPGRRRMSESDPLLHHVLKHILQLCQ
jgi:hypothetical protein